MESLTTYGKSFSPGGFVIAIFFFNALSTITGLNLSSPDREAEKYKNETSYV